MTDYSNNSHEHPVGYDEKYANNDAEKGHNNYGHTEIEAVEPKAEETHRSLKPRQISMIAIGE